MARIAVLGDIVALAQNPKSAGEHRTMRTLTIRHAGNFVNRLKRRKF